ncbi:MULTISPECIES: hypothetical protein [Thermomonosporaceae]|uniref:hypothetical protein n=1 Tax=Thermomonosporaceae TaxID=2012 RepID=UPI00255A894C|nr:MULTISPECIES: hypothetical protein [Thermomonosporaceae]MDL4771879.1 hypothetical protein [Actinomadura xylanilytica]
MFPDQEQPPSFDEEFVKGASFKEPSARERARPPGPAQRWRTRRARKRWRSQRTRPRSGGGAVRGQRDPDHARAVVKVAAGVVVLLAISTALWWFNSGPGTGPLP